MQRFVIGPASHGDDGNILLVTLGLAIIIENALLALFRSDTRSLATALRASTSSSSARCCCPSRGLIGFVGAVAGHRRCSGCCWPAPTPARRSAPSPRKSSAPRSSASTSAHVYAVTFGLGCACLAIAACLLMPTFYVNPARRRRLRARRLHHRRAGRHGLDPRRAGWAGCSIGVVESLCGLFLGESLGQIGIFLIFILVLLFRPTGLFGARA